MALNKSKMDDVFSKKILEHDIKFIQGSITREWFIKYIKELRKSAKDLNLGDTARKLNEKLESM